MPTLFAWAVPAFFGGSPVDHTWVTDFDSRIVTYPSIQAVIDAQANYWFCWGSYHPKGGTPQIPNGYLGSNTASLGVASCLVAPNLPCPGNPPAQGTIFHYGIDGVCHQLANQVLWSTNASPNGPLTVHLARGYAFSTFLFWTYGRQHAAWLTKSNSCVNGGQGKPVHGMLEQSVEATTDDEFEKRAREVLKSPDASQRLRHLLELRTTTLRTAEAMRSRLSADMVAPSGAELNAHYNEVLRQAASILTVTEYRELFGFEPGEMVNLVDPAMVAPSSGRVL